MTAHKLGRAAARLANAVKPATSKATSRAGEFARNLRAEFEAGQASAATDEVQAAEVADAMRSVDWAKVRAATSAKSSEAAASMKTMAAEVDWDKVQPVAAKVSSALIAAVASGHLGVGGRLAPTVARAIMNDRNLAQRVSTTLAADDAATPDFRQIVIAGAIDATSSE
ncbi:MAG TPA: hypothetical protein PK020_02705 [Ilumatobacteraceae bacterium]|nr:hypothetical protein [Ilumatobacteraceae bacterium]HRB02117.1 hypothetical protein [Ilumatobacteraceae bacterium]